MENNTKEFIHFSHNILPPDFDITSIVNDLVVKFSSYNDLQNLFKHSVGLHIVGHFWHDKNGKETLDRQELVQRVPLRQEQFRYSETEDDFPITYERLRKENKLDANYAYFNQTYIPDRINHLIDDIKKQFSHSELTNLNKTNVGGVHFVFTKFNNSVLLRKCNVVKVKVFRKIECDRLTNMQPGPQITLGGTSPYLAPAILGGYRLIEVAQRFLDWVANEKFIRLSESAEGSISLLEENLFNSKMIDDVRDYFKDNLCVKNTEGAYILNPIDLEKFISAAFLGKPLKGKLFLNIGKKGNAKVGSVFHKFYLESKQLELTDHCALKYRKLATDHFSNWTENRFLSFFRS